MKSNETKISLTRKLRELIGLSEITLSPEEGELYGLQGIDHLEPELWTKPKSGSHYE